MYIYIVCRSVRDLHTCIHTIKSETSMIGVEYHIRTRMAIDTSGHYTHSRTFRKCSCKIVYKYTHTQTHKIYYIYIHNCVYIPELRGAFSIKYIQALILTMLFIILYLYAAE